MVAYAYRVELTLSECRLGIDPDHSGTLSCLILKSPFILTIPQRRCSIPRNATDATIHYHCPSLLGLSFAVSPCILSPLCSISFCLDNRTCSGNPHHSLINSSCACATLAFRSRSRWRSIRRANHSSRASSCADCVACSFMQLFMERCSARQAKETVNVRPRAHAANAGGLLVVFMT